MADQMTEKARNQLLLVLFLGVLMAALDIAVTGPALPAIEQQFGMDSVTSSWIFGIYIVANLVATPLLAKLSDRYGRRFSFLLSIVVFGIGSVVVATSASVPLLLIGRAIQGFGAGGVFPVASAVVGDVFPIEQRGRALGMIGAVFGIAFLIGPILGGVLLLFGWPWLFWINVPIVVLIVGLGLRLLPQGGGRQGAPFDWTGSVLLSGMLIAVAYGLQGIGAVAQGVFSTQLWALLVAVVIAPVFVWAERRAVDPVVQLGLFGRVQVLLILSLAFASGMAEAVTLYVPSLLVSAFQMSESTASFQLLPMVLAMAVASPVSGRMLDRYGAKPVVLSGVLLMVVSLVLIGMWPASLVIYYVFAVIFGLGIAVLLGAALRYMMLGETEPSERGAAQALLTIVISVGQMIGAALMGSVAASQADRTAGYALALLVTAGVLGVVFVAGSQLRLRQVVAVDTAA